MTDLTHNFHDDPRECLAHYAAKHPDSLMGYRPYVDNELTRHFVALGALEWSSIEGVRYCKLTPDGRRMLEEYCHAETRAQLAAANKRIAELESPEHQTRYQHLQQYEQMLAAAEQRIAELEAVCREVVAALELERIEDDIRFAVPVPSIKTHYDLQGDDYDGLFDAFAHLLDTLPPAE